jgi:hypothetical protein
MALGEILDLSAFSKAMKIRGMFDKQFRQFYVQGFLLENLRRKGGRVPLGGREMEIPLETRGMASIGAQQELEAITEPDNPAFAIAKIPIKTLTSRFQISLHSHLSSKDNRAAWVGGQIKSMSSTVEMFAMGLSRLLHGWGSGALAKVVSVAADTPVVGEHTITLHADQATLSGGTFGRKYMIRGGRLAASSSLTGLICEKHADLRVKSIGKTTETIIVTGSLGTGAFILAADDYLFLGSKDRTSKGRAPMGVYGYLDSTKAATVLSIDRTAAGNEYFDAFRSTAVGGADLENRIQIQCDNVMTQIGLKTQIILMAMGVWRKFAADLRGDRRFVTAAETGKYKGGTNMLMYDGADGEPIPIVRDRDVPTGTMWGLHWDAFYLGELHPAQWLKQFDESSIFRQIPDTLGWEAIYAWIGELVCVQPAGQWLDLGIDEI